MQLAGSLTLVIGPRINPYDFRCENTPRMRFFATLGEEQEVEVMLWSSGYALEPCSRSRSKSGVPATRGGICEDGLGGGGPFQECLQVPHDPPRPHPVRKVAGLRVHQQGGVGDRRRAPLLFLARQ